MTRHFDRVRNISLFLIIFLAAVYCAGFDVSVDSFSSGGSITGKSVMPVSHSMVSLVHSGIREDTADGSSWCKYLCSYLLICAVSFLYGKAAVIPGVIAALIFAAFAAYCAVRKKLSLTDILRAAVLAAASLVCSWVFIDWLL